MSTHPITTLRSGRRAAALAALAAAAAIAVGPAHAAVLAPNPPNTAGDFANISYGSGGDVYELQPYLYVNGLGSAGDARSVAARNPALAYSFSWGSVNANLWTVEYRITNTSATESFDQLRLMVFANPDGDPAQFADVVTESWGAATAADPVRREVMALPAAQNIVSGFALNNNLTDGGFDAACAASAGCDATVALQWNAAVINPGESFSVRVGLSDNGASLSSRFLRATAVNSPGTALTLSGIAQVSAVPEPSTWSMAVAGLLALSLVVGRRLQGR